MSATFIKACPLCLHQNLPISSFCEQCDADLMNAPVEMRPEADERDVKLVEETAPQNFAVGNLGNQNAAVAPLRPTNGPSSPPDQNELETRRAGAASGGLHLELVSNPALRFMVLPGQSVGRASKADVVLGGVPELEYISRIHARFTQRKTQWYVQYIAEGNAITVDGIESRDNAELAIYDGSIVVLSFTAFTVRLT